MADYYRVKNQNIFNPPANTSLGNTTNQFSSVVVQNDLVLGDVTVTGSTIIAPRVSSITYPGDDTAADTAGGQTITLTGSGFVAGASVLINGSAVSVVTVVSSTSITFTSPVLSTGSYVLYVINPDGSTAISVPGIQYSGTPAWTTAAGSLGSVYETASFSQTVAATGDAPVTYSIFSGTIPPGATFNSNGAMTGTSELLSSPTTYTFTVRATDAQNQDTNRSFSLTITPDVVTWSSPANNTTYALSANVAMANVTLSATSAVNSAIVYSANSLPTGLSLTGAVISGTPTVIANTSSLLTATANTTSESSSRTINWVVSLANDTFFKYNSLLIPGANTTFVDDASTNNFGVTIFGDTRPNNNNPYTPGYYSNYFDGSGDYLSTSAGASAFDFSSTKTLTFECWFSASAFSGNHTLLSINECQPFRFIVTSSTLLWQATGSGTTILTTSQAWAVGAWYHIACVRDNDTLYMFVNGAQVATASYSTSWGATSTSYPVVVGANRTDTFYFNGNISNLRLVKGTALYTSSFTPSTTPLTAVSGTSLLTCQSNRFIDNSTNNFTLTVAGNTTISSFNPFIPNSSYSTYGSGYFDGTGDYLSLASNSAFTVGTGDLTIEAWIYCTSLTSGYQGIISGRVATPSEYPGLGLTIDNTALLFTITNAVSSGLRDTVAVPLNQWVHVAGVRSGTNAALFVNGVRKAFSASNSENGTSSAMAIGRYYPATDNYHFSGYISNARLVKGTAVYDPTLSTLTVPTSPLTAISGTSLLTLQNNQSVNNSTFLDNSTNNFLVTRAGNATQGTFSPYGANWSNLFDGNGDYLRVPSTGAEFSSITTFTYECWINPTAALGTNCIFDISECQPFRFVLSGSNVTWQATVSGSTILTATFTWVIGTWYHVAFVRSGSNISIFINGTRYATTTYSGNWGATGSSGVNIGCNRGDSWFFPGYISNARFVKGTAVYDPTQTTITVPTSPLTAISGTSLLTCADNRFIDDSTNAFTITKNGDTKVQRFSPFNPAGEGYTVSTIGGSAYFDGTGDYLSSAVGTTLNVPANTNFTIEGWCYLNSLTATRPAIFSNYNSFTTGGLAFFAGHGASTTTQFQVALNGTFPALDAGTIPYGSWFHWAIVRNGTGASNITVYINGVSIGNITSNVAITSTGNSLWLGASGDSIANAGINGYMSDFRWVNGTAVYTAAFTPPSAPLTAITNTVSLLNMTSAGIYDASMINDIETVGHVKLTHAVSKFGGTSMYFDGTGDYLIYPDSPNQEFGSSNLTWEMWVNTTNSVQYTTLYSRTPSTFATGMWSLMMNFASATTGDIALFVGDYSTGAPLLQTTGVSIRDGNWHHVAVVRNGSAWVLYVDGTSRATGTWAGTIADITAGVCVGADQFYGRAFTGYIDDLRITKGYARYTANFTAPTSAFPIY